MNLAWDDQDASNQNEPFNELFWLLAMIKQMSLKQLVARKFFVEHHTLWASEINILDNSAIVHSISQELFGELPFAMSNYLRSVLV